MRQPPPIPTVRKKNRLVLFLIIGGVVLLVLLIVGSIFAVRFISQQNFTEPMDKKFGDQHLKTTVALIELHKIRFGKYPDSLKDLKYTGAWDRIHISSVKYYPSEDRQSYYIEVGRGWVGKPALVMPEDFWQNTGYDKNLKPEKE